MLDLKNFSQSDPCQRLIDAVLKVFQDGQSSYLQGFVVSRPPSWNWLRRFEQQGWDERFPEAIFQWPWIGPATEQYYTSDGTNENLQKMWRDRYSPRQPFLLKVCVGPTRPDTISTRRTLQILCANEQEFFAIVEDRAPASLISLEGGRSVTAGSHTGTIGGFLKDQHGHVHGVTCGHVGQVVGNTVSVQDIGGSTVTCGSVVQTNWPLVAASSITLCQPKNAKNQVDMSLTDLSLGQVGTSHVRGIGTINDIYLLSSLGSGHTVRMSGAISGADEYQITGYVITYRINQSGSYYCFSNVFEIAGIPIPGILSSRTPTPKSGDSGAWVCCPKDDGGNALCGMVFAADHARGYACFTDEMKAWAAGSGVGLNLQVL